MDQERLFDGKPHLEGKSSAIKSPLGGVADKTHGGMQQVKKLVKTRPFRKAGSMRG